jgi:hypothetical protein
MMDSRSILILVPLLLGTVCGVLFANMMWWHKSDGELAGIWSAPILGPVLHAPALGIFQLCHTLGIGPSGDGAWLMMPWCIIA